MYRSMRALRPYLGSLFAAV